MTETGSAGAVRVAVLAASSWLVAASVFVVVPGGFVRFVFAKVALLGLAVVVGSFGRSRTGLPTVLVRLCCAAVVVFVAAALLSDTPVASLLGRWPRYEGVPMLACYLVCFWLGARLTVLGEERPATLVTPLAAAAVGLGVLSIAERAGLSPLADAVVSRPGTVLGNAADQGAVGVLLALTLLPTLLDPAAPVPRWLTAAGVAGGLTAMVASQSRSSVLAFVVGVGLLVFLGGRRRQVLVALSAASVAAAGILMSRWAESSTVTGRLVLWRDSLDLAGDDLLTGVGPSRFVDAIGAHHGADWVREVGADNPPDSPHNVVLLLILAGGIPLLTLVLALAAAAARDLVRRRAADGLSPLTLGAAAASAALGVTLLGNVLLPGTLALGFVLVGLALGEERADSGARGLPVTRWVPWAAVTGTVVAVYAGYGCVAEIALQDGLDQLAAGDSADAQTSFDRAATFRPGDGDTCQIAATGYAARAISGDRIMATHALEWSECSLDRTPDTLGAGLARALAVLVLDRPREALTTLDRLAEIHPTVPEVYEQRAVVYDALGRAGSATADRETAVRLTQMSADGLP